jgi:hypothetical protein
MSLLVINPDGTEKRCCVWCKQYKADTYCTNPRHRKVNRDYLCEACHADIIRKSIVDYREQTKRGVPRGSRMVLIPMLYGVRVYSDRMDAELARFVRREYEAEIGAERGRVHELKARQASA